MRCRALVVVVLAVVAASRPHSAIRADDLPFRNPDLPLDRRVDDLLGRLTLAEKASLMLERAAPIERLGIPAFAWWNEALHGAARAGLATVFPQAIGLAATWDTDLMLRVATAISDEARAKHHQAARLGRRHIYQGLTFWSPNINIFRDPRWGRGQETYGEDPFLTGALAVAFVKGMQGDDPVYLKTVATPKHFAVHSGPEPLRHVFDAHVSEADLRETYLPAFRAAIVEGKAASVMCAYNSVGGLPACGNQRLLATILRQEWGFDGYVVSDCAAIHDIYLQHKVRASSAEASAMAVLAGCDLECGSGASSPGSPDNFPRLDEAVQAGLVAEREIDRALRRLLVAQFRLGVYDPDDRVRYARIPNSVVDSAAHRALALEAARKSIVLLKNAGNTLPLSRSLTSIAVIGPNAASTEVLLGNYNGTPADPVSILEGLRARLGASVKVVHARGSRLADGIDDLDVVPASALSTRTAGGRVAGLTGEYFRGAFEGAPVATRVDATIDFDWKDGAPFPSLDADAFSVRWRGELSVPADGAYTLAFQAATGFAVYLDGRPFLVSHSDHEPPLATRVVRLRAGQAYPVRIEYYHQKYDALARLLWEPPGRSYETEALEAARGADAVVLALGLSSRLEGEEMRVPVEGFSEGDRTSLDLPAAQQRLLERVVTEAAGKPVVLVLLSGSAVALTWADANVPAILQAWYPGQAGGTAVADVLFGDASPGGRLPVTFYRSVDQLPPFDDYAMRNRTYRYFTGEPLYPFGHGLSYARFEYSDLRLPDAAAVGDRVHVSVRVKNASGVTADEVVQLYVARQEAASGAPLRSLKGFRRITLGPGDERDVTFALDDRALSLVGSDGRRVVAPGRVIVSVGGRQPGPERVAGAATPQVVAGTVVLRGTALRLAP
jgi:beta-glucosidase